MREFGTSVKETVDKDPFGKYETEIDISFVRAVDEDIVCNVLPRTPGETIEDNRWLKLYKEELGINVKYDWTVRGGYQEDAYVQQINFTLASGNLPDVITVSASQLKQLADLGVIEDMTRYYDDYASPLTKYVYTQEGTSVLDSATFDGKLMGIPNVDSSIESAQFIWIRTDWLRKLGLEPPKTMDDLLKISEAFTFNDPDGNGKDDTYGIAIMKDLFNGCIGLEGFFAGYHSYPGIWLE
ncbi:MAG: extracellular solute-binding protein, partial [Clostridiaceae bacterium]|nr:extracellular solute-binding protein [Clostridiaceae bacterium]